MIGISSGMGIGDFPRPTQCKKSKKNFKLLKLEFPEGWGGGMDIFLEIHIVNNNI